MIPKEFIKKKCEQLEKEKGIKILFAVESGSRAWGMESKDSDYDVRFVFKRDIKNYLSINPSKEVINASYDKEGKVCSPEGCFFDFVGFDLFKFCRMLSSSNPNVIDWMQCDQVYYGVKNDVFVDYALKHFKPISLYFHNKSMCKNNYLKYLKSGDFVTYKKYLYAMRGLVNAKFVAYFSKLPDINFLKTLDKMGELLPNHISDRVKEIVVLKKNGKEKEIIDNEVKIDRFIEGFLKDDSEAPVNKRCVTQTGFNEEIWKIFDLV